MTEDQSTPDDRERPEGEPRFSFTDKRKVNPEDGSVRSSGATPADPVDPIDAEAARLFEQAAQGGGDSAPADAGQVAELEGRITELTEQLKREQADYVNSRRRIEAQAETGKEVAVGKVLTSLLSVLDDVELGRQHGDIAEGTPFHAIAQKLEEALGGHGLERFGAVGEEFDPNLHEALMHEEGDDVEVATISLVMQPGYRMNERILRPARVGTRGPAPFPPIPPQTFPIPDAPEGGASHVPTGLAGQGLLCGPRRLEGRERGGDQEGLSQAGPQTPSRPPSR